MQLMSKLNVYISNPVSISFKCEIMFKVKEEKYVGNGVDQNLTQNKTWEAVHNLCRRFDLQYHYRVVNSLISISYGTSVCSIEKVYEKDFMWTL